jgi:hypothetical protein
MTDDSLAITVRFKAKISKYAEGTTPGIDEPYEVVDGLTELTGKEAEDFIGKLKQED